MVLTVYSVNCSRAGGSFFLSSPADPSIPVDKEQSGFTGGYIVQTYGSHKSQPIDAMQLEFGSQYRTSAARPQTAAVLADALADYASNYLAVDVPPRTTALATVAIRPEMQPKPSSAQASPSQPIGHKHQTRLIALQVALFVDAGVSSTTKLLELLEHRPQPGGYQSRCGRVS